MYYNQERVETELNDGISDAAGVTEELFEHMNALVSACRDGDEAMINHLCDEWEDK